MMYDGREGEGVKWELGSFFCWENGINSTGTGMLSLGMGFENGIPIFGSAQTRFD